MTGSIVYNSYLPGMVNCTEHVYMPVHSVALGLSLQSQDHTQCTYQQFYGTCPVKDTIQVTSPSKLKLTS